jgi:hypothetical protein
MSKPRETTRKTSSAKLRSFLHIRFGSFRFNLALLIAAFALHVINELVANMPFAEPVNKDLALEFRKRQLDIWTEMNKLLITLSTATIAVVGRV